LCLDKRKQKLRDIIWHLNAISSCLSNQISTRQIGTSVTFKETEDGSLIITEKESQLKKIKKERENK